MARQTNGSLYSKPQLKTLQSRPFSLREDDPRRALQVPERNAQKAALALRPPHRQSSEGDQEEGCEGVREGEKRLRRRCGSRKERKERKDCGRVEGEGFEEAKVKKGRGITYQSDFKISISEISKNLSMGLT